MVSPVRGLLPHRHERLERVHLAVPPQRVRGLPRELVGPCRLLQDPLDRNSVQSWVDLKHQRDNACHHRRCGAHGARHAIQPPAVHNQIAPVGGPERLWGVRRDNPVSGGGDIHAGPPVNRRSDTAPCPQLANVALAVQPTAHTVDVGPSCADDVAVGRHVATSRRAVPNAARHHMVQKSAVLPEGRVEGGIEADAGTS